MKGLHRWGGSSEKWGVLYSDLKIHNLLRKRAHLIVKAKTVLSHVISCKHKVALSLSLPLHDRSFVWPDDLIIDIESSTGLDLYAYFSYLFSK